MPQSRSIAHAAEHPDDESVSSKKEPQDRQFVTALARGLKILSCFSADRPELNGSEIAKLTGLPQPTVWRLCYTLLELGMLISTSADKMRPGLAVLRLGHSALADLNTTELIRPHMQALADKYRAACGLATREGLDMVYIERCEGRNQMLMNLRRGSVVPVAASALGWAYMAGLSGAQRNALLAEIEASDEEHWPDIRKDFKKALADYEVRGYVLYKRAFQVAHNTVAVPVFGRDGSVRYVLNCGSASVMLPVTMLRKEIAPQLVELARLLESVIQA